jgi:transcription elongation factor GreB
MTVEGHTAIQAEIDFLWSKERPEIVNQVTAAAELGDRSENAEYIYGKKRLREIDSRLRYLQKKIDGVTVVELSSMPAHKDVRFGAIVTVEDDDGQRTFRLVDQDESDPSRRRISIQSPIGRALLGKKVGDHVEVELPKDRISLEIVEIRYGGGEP